VHNAALPLAFNGRRRLLTYAVWYRASLLAPGKQERFSWGGTRRSWALSKQPLRGLMGHLSFSAGVCGDSTGSVLSLFVQSKQK